MELSLTSTKIVCFVFLFLNLSSESLPGAEVEDGALTALKAELRRFEQMHWGLMYTRSGFRDRRTRIEISSDGNLCRSMDDQTNKGVTVRNSMYGNFIEGWLFTTSRTVPAPSPEKARGGSPHIVAFGYQDSSPKYLADSVGWVDSGVVHGRTFTEYVDSSSVEIKKVDGEKVVLSCQHNELPDCDFIFNKDSELVGLSYAIRPGDQVWTNAKYEDPIIAEEGVNNRFEYRFSYGTCNGRRVLTEMVAELRLGPNSKAAGEPVKFTYQGFRNAPTLPSTIELPAEQLQDGQGITCQGRHAVRYELLNGRPVIAIDAASVREAEKARFIKSRTGWATHYLLLVVAGVVVGGVWLRYRGAV